MFFFSIKMNIAEITANLADKDRERGLIFNEIQSLKRLASDKDVLIITVLSFNFDGATGSDALYELSFQLVDMAGEPSNDTAITGVSYIFFNVQ